MTSTIESAASAVFGANRIYRYTLTRNNIARGSESTACFVMLNPSTADEHQDDPTIRRCIGFARGWGYTRLHVVNLFALRSTDPRGLALYPEPVGPDNDRWIIRRASESDIVVCAWGTHGRLHGRGDQVVSLLSGVADLWCLGQTKDGYPKHPLYLSSRTQAQPFEHNKCRPSDECTRIEFRRVS